MLKMICTCQTEPPVHYHTCPPQTDCTSCICTSRLTCMFRHEGHPNEDVQGDQDSNRMPSNLSSFSGQQYGTRYTPSDRMEWYDVSQILLGSSQCLANCMNTRILWLHRCTGFHPQLSLNCATRNANTSVSVYVGI